MRFQFRTSAFLWAMLLFAVCTGWLADRSRLQIKLNQMTKFYNLQSQLTKQIEGQFRYCSEVNKELRDELHREKYGESSTPP